ncbi:hypothetical protein EYZ11_011884 [Aspergillus tanneri]|uniref:Rhodopsin domain-containing protein n=1 Tax=Aspergillus tanneri TaxID=1220188 RepID=A0A4S3J1Q2_9EURO|nr:uncharacterized protein ATNIH1004_009458 [Aspergillus tanneri]KAA8642706.1 hypothetical protein ATNIH1004_009458 [Aspergillus tanneri]THC88666.1 hypothetical protein EYZ11_011884 [Aspergillus tanneri]
MATPDHFGRIHKSAFVVSTAVLLAVALVGVVIRYVIRFRTPKRRFQLDDGLLLLAVILLLTSLIIMYHHVVDPMFLLGALQNRVQGVELPANVLQISHDFHKWNVAALMISWCSICAVKFYFLIFFKRLIDRLRLWQLYWWVVTVFNVALLFFGVTVYYISCPFWDARELQCSSGRYKLALIRDSAAQISLDIAADLLILVIPIGLIWKIRVQWTQKLALMSSLCLTFVLVALSITRVAGLEYHDVVDAVWETYWQTLSAELGVFLAAASTFRSFFVSQRNNRAYTPPSSFDRWIKSSTLRSSDRKQPDTLLTSWPDNTASAGFEHLSQQANGDSKPHVDYQEWHAMTRAHSSTGQSSNAMLDNEAVNDSVHSKPFVAEPASVLLKVG